MGAIPTYDIRNALTDDSRTAVQNNCAALHPYQRPELVRLDIGEHTAAGMAIGEDGNVLGNS
jgi:hypothetical protein